MEPISPLYTAELFVPLHDELIRLLEGLRPEDWTRPTLAGEWRVRDIVAHLVEVDLRRLSVGRDGHLIAPDRPIASYRDLVTFLNDLNARWVSAASRLSTRVLIELLQYSGPAMARLVADLPPHAPAVFAVDWAGETQSENWFDIGRDYTERWHHQMQIRDAVGAPPLLEPRWSVPLFDLSFRSLPRAYASVDAQDGSTVELHVGGDTGTAWTLQRDHAAWRLWRGTSPGATTMISVDPDTAWRILYNAIPLSEARDRTRVEGDPTLAAPFYAARSVMV